MTKDEAVQKLAKVARISVAHAEDIYDTVVPKPVIPYYIADYIEEVKSKGDYTVVGAVNEAPDGRVGDWLFLERVNIFAAAWVNGYIAEGEPSYTVKIKGVADDYSFLNYDKFSKYWFVHEGHEETMRFRTAHTRKELEEAGFDWVFNCPGVEVKEVE